MAFDVDDFLGEKKPEPKGTGTPPAPSMVREPRAKTDAELGLDAGPLKAERPAVGLERLAPDDRSGAPAGPLEARKFAEDPVRNDPLAGAIVAGIPAAGLGALAAPALAATGAAPLVARAGAGAIEGATAAKLQGGDPVTGAALGAALPVAGKVAGKATELVGDAASKFVQGAPERATNRALTALTEDVRQTLKNRITEPAAQARITKVFAQPEVRQAAENPGELLKLSGDGLKTSGEAAQKGYAMLDKSAGAKGGRPGMEVVDVTAPLLKLRKEMVDRSEHPTAIATVDRVIDQFRSGIGRDPAKPIPSADVRGFLTKQIQAPGFGRGDPLSDPPPARAALQEMSGVLKDSLTAYAKKNGGETAASAMSALNDKITAYSLMEKSATERLAKQQQAPGAFDAVKRAAMGHKAEGVGAALGYGMAGPLGSLAGAGVGHVVSKLPGAVDEALSNPAAQMFARGGVRVEPLAHQAAIPVASAILRKDPDAATRELVKAVTQ